MFGRVPAKVPRGFSEGHWTLVLIQKNQASVLVFQVRGPNVAIKQAWWIWHCVVTIAPPLVAFVIWDGNKVVQHVDHKSVGAKKKTPRDENVSLFFVHHFRLGDNLSIHGVK